MRCQTHKCQAASVVKAGKQKIHLNAHLRGQLHFQTPQADIEIFTHPRDGQTTKLWASTQIITYGQAGGHEYL